MYLAADKKESLSEPGCHNLQVHANFTNKQTTRNFDQTLQVYILLHLTTAT